MANSSFFGTSGTTASVTNTIQTSVDAAATSATNAETAKTDAETAKSAAETAKTAAETAKADAEKLAVNAEDSQFTLSDSTTGYSALHHREKANDAQSAAETAKTSAESARDTASDHKDDAEKLATNAEDSEFTLSDNTTGYSALHYNAKAQAAKTAAETAKTSAESALSSFQGQYSTGASDPTTNLDAGDLFFNTTDDEFKVYSGSAWQLTIPTSSNQTNINTVAGIESDVTAVAGKATEIGRLGTADAVADMNTLGTAAIVADMDALADITSDITTVADNVSGVNSFADRYRVGTNDPSSDNDEGDLFYNTTSNTLKVYTGSAWEQGVTAGSGFLPLSGGQLTGNLTFSGSQTVDGRDVSADGTKLDGIETGATADQTAAEIRTLVESATDSNVFTDADHTKLNGIEASADVTDTTNVVAALTAGSDISIAADGTIAYTGASDVVGDTTPQLGGALDTNGNNIEFPDSSGAEVNRLKFGTGDDLQIFHNGTNSVISDQGTGNLLIQGSQIELKDAGNSETLAQFAQNGAASLYYDNSKKIETTSTGIDVTGTAEMDTLSIGGTAVTATAAELNYVDGVTSNIQTQIDNINTDLSNDTTPQLGGNLDTNGNSILFGSSKWSIELDTGDNDLLFKYNGTTVFKLASNGAVVSADNVTAYGTP